MTKKYEPSSAVLFAGYATPPSPEEEAPYAVGDLLEIVDLADGSDLDDDDPLYSVKRAEDGEAGWVYASEIEAVKTENKKSLTVFRDSAKKKEVTEAIDEKMEEEAPIRKPAKQILKEQEEARKTAAKKTAKKKTTAKKTAKKKVAAKKVDAAPEEVEVKKEIVVNKKAEKKVNTEVKITIEEAITDVRPLTSVKKLLEEGNLLVAAQTISKAIKASYITLGGVLFEIKKQALFEKVKDAETGEALVGQPGFSTYISQELGVEYRVAQHWIAIYQALLFAGITEKEALGVKWSKMKELVPLMENGVITRSNWATWKRKAIDLKGVEYADEVKQAKVDAGIVQNPRGGGPKTDVTTFSLRPFADRAKVWEKAMELAVEEMPPTDDGAPMTKTDIFDHIVSFYIDAKTAGK